MTESAPSFAVEAEPLGGFTDRLGRAIVGVASFPFRRERFDTWWRWQPPTLYLPGPELAMGVPVTVRYERPSRSAVDVSAASIVLRLSCEEHVWWDETRRTQDNRTRTTRKHDEAVVHRSQAQAHVSGTPEGLAADVAVSIPLFAGAPSFRGRNHAIRWFLDAQLHAPGLPNDVYRFGISVAPRIGHGGPPSHAPGATP